MILPLLFVLTLQDGPATAAAPAADAAIGNVRTEETLFGPDPGIGAFDPVRDRDGRPICDRDGSTPQINACFSDDLALEQARMQRYLEAAVVRAEASDNPEESFGEATQSSAYLQASQAAWMAYADIRCTGVLDQWKGGTIRTIMYLGCMIAATRARTHDIWSDYLTYADSTPPEMPEPVTPVVHQAE